MQRSHHGWSARGSALAMVLAAVVLGAAAVTPAPAAASPPSAGPRGGTTKTATVSGAVPVTTITLDVDGGYVAAGTGLRNRGQGTIKVSGLPSGASIVTAYLYWSIQGTSASAPASFATGAFEGTDITGTPIGSGAGSC